MSAVIQEFITLLTRPPGNLIYHVIVAYSVAAALPSAISLWRVSDYPQGRRMVIGLGLILLAWLGLFLLGGLSWQGLIPEHNLLPPLDRGVTLFSLILIIWLWAFPEPHRLADAATLLVILLTITLSGLNIAWWHYQGNDVAYNSLLVDRIGQGYAGFLAFVGIVILIFRRPSGWSFGISMLGLLLLGHLAQLFLPNLKGDYAGLVRLTQVAAFPILLALPQRFPLPGLAPGLPISTNNPPARRSEEVELVQSALDLATLTETDQICKSAVKLIAQCLLADVCVLVSSPDAAGQMSILCGYDLIREKQLEGANLDGQKATVIAAAMRQANPLNLPKNPTSPDQIKLAQALNLESTGNLLAAPLTAPDGGLLFGIILLAPYTNRSWRAEDQTLLTSISNSLARLLQQSNRMAALNVELKKMQQSYQTAQLEIDSLRQERQNLLARLEISPRQAEAQAVEADEIEAFLTAQQKAQAAILSLQEEIKQLRQAQQPAQKTLSLPEEEARQQALEGELHLALEEIARLRALTAGEAGLETASQPRLVVRSNDERIATLTNLTLELRKPLSSISGYTEFLLGESVGILGSLQRKFLERIKQATERMNLTLDEITRLSSRTSQLGLTSQETGILQLNPEPVDLGQMINQAIQKTSNQMRQKRIAMQVGMPETLPRLMADFDSLEQVLVNLLENAVHVTPPEGEISLQVSTHDEKGVQGFVLIQIADQGGGIDPQELPNIFSPSNREPVKGVGDSGAGLSVVKSMIENQGGRIWVDTQPSRGATFSVLMPVIATAMAKDVDGGAWN